MSDISKFSPDGGTTTYDIKDALARALQNEYGVHNLMPFNPVTVMNVYHLSIEARPNGTIRLNLSSGETATNNDISFGLNDSNYLSQELTYCGVPTLKAGTYKLIVNSSSALTSNIAVKAYNMETSAEILSVESGTRSVNTFTLSADARVFVYVFVASGQSPSNFDIQAFIIRGDDTDETYSPYGMSNTDLTESCQQEIIYDANTTSEEKSGRIKYYFAKYQKGNIEQTLAECHLPKLMNGNIIELNPGSRFATQIFIPSTTNNEIWIRSKNSSYVWPEYNITTNPHSGWKEVWYSDEDISHNYLYSHQFIKTTTTSALKWQDYLYWLARGDDGTGGIVGLKANLPSGYRMIIEQLVIGTSYCVPAYTLVYSTGASTSMSPIFTYKRIGSTYIIDRDIFLSSGTKSSNTIHDIKITRATGAVEVEEFTNQDAIAANSSLTTTIFYRLMKATSTDPTE